MASWYIPVDCNVPISIYSYCVETVGNLVCMQRRSVPLNAALIHREENSWREQLEREHTSRWLQNGNYNYFVADMHKKHLLIRADMQNRLTVLFTHGLAPLTIKTARLIEPRPLLLKISLARMRHCNAYSIVS